MRVALADDSGLFREGLALLLAGTGVEVSTQARDADELLGQIEHDPPDAVIVDIRMAPTFTDEGLVVADRIKRRHPGVGVLVLSAYAEASYAIRLLGDNPRGVGYLLKERVDDIGALNDALAQVTSGRLAIDESIVALMMSDMRTPAELDRLSERERAILAVMAEGRSNLGIAQRLSLSTKTVENYLTTIFSKLGLANSGDDNRRVLATLLWLRVHQQHAPAWDPAGRHQAGATRSRPPSPIRPTMPAPPARSR